MRSLRLLKLHCNKTYDDHNPKSNETFLAVENGIFHIFGPTSIMNKSEWKINADVQFNKQTKISFFDEDFIRNLSATKNFRNYVVEENEIYDISKTINFATNTNYILTLK